MSLLHHTMCSYTVMWSAACLVVLVKRRATTLLLLVVTRPASVRTAATLLLSSSSLAHINAYVAVHYTGMRQLVLGLSFRTRLQMVDCVTEYTDITVSWYKRGLISFTSIRRSSLPCSDFHEICKWAPEQQSGVKLHHLHLTRTQYSFAGQFTSSYLWNKLIPSIYFVCVQVNGHNLKDINSHQMINGWCTQYLMKNM